MRARIPPIKLVASAITIGSGRLGRARGAGGADLRRLRLAAGRTGCGSTRRTGASPSRPAWARASARSSARRSAARCMAAEILYLHDLEVEALIPGLIASIVGYSVFGAFFGWTPIFGAQPRPRLRSARCSSLYYAALGLLCGLVGILYARGFYGIDRAVPPAAAAATGSSRRIGGLLVGLIGLLIPGALHTGYGWVQIGMTDASCWACRSGSCCCCPSRRSSPPRSRSARAGRAASSARAW